MTETLKIQILEMLRQDGRLSDSVIASRLNTDENTINASRKQLEEEGTIVAYRAIINPENSIVETVEAIIEVKVVPTRGHGFDQIARRIEGFSEVRGIMLMSGGTDFLLFMEGKSVKDIARFVTEKLSTLENVQATTTHFVLKEYKREGVSFFAQTQVERLVVSP